MSHVEPVSCYRSLRPAIRSFTPTISIGLDRIITTTTTTTFSTGQTLKAMWFDGDKYSVPPAVCSPPFGRHAETE